MIAKWSKELNTSMGLYLIPGYGKRNLWVIFLAETSKDLEINLIIIVLSFTNRLSRTSLYLSLKTSFVYSNLFSLAKTVTIRCHIQTSKRVRSPSSACKKARATAKNYNPSIISLLPLAAML